MVSFKASLSCHSCSNVKRMDCCKTITACESGDTCFTRPEQKGESASYTMGCTRNENCGKIPVNNNVSKLSNGQHIQECYECCGVGRCNNDLCKYKTLDGNWADWSSWSSCDVTCGHGKHTRIRTCTNPAPVYHGRLDCKGSSSDTKSYIRPLCPASNGGWSDWVTWSTCSESCGVEVKTRSRSCTNPVPGTHGEPCVGDPIQVETCNEEDCQSVAFNAYYVTDCSPAIDQTMIFSKTLLNEGDAYNTSTGIFVAPRNETYTFEAQMCILNQRFMQFDTMVGSAVHATAFGCNYNYYECPSAHAIVKLNSGDSVTVQWKTWSYSTFNAIPQNKHYRYSFSGKLSNP